MLTSSRRLVNVVSVCLLRELNPARSCSTTLGWPTTQRSQHPSRDKHGRRTSLSDETEQDLFEDEFLTVEEEEQVTQSEPEIAPITYSGTDFDVEGLVRRLKRGDIAIPSFGHGDPTLEAAGFQRSFVWRRPQMDRFIESLLLGFPIPGIILVLQQDKRYLVLDGQQRLRTLGAFYNGVYGGYEFALQNVADEFRDLTYETLSPELRRQLDNTFIQATIVNTDGTKESLEAVYQVFERLNSGGTQLTPHEIRIALYPGEMVDFLEKMNNLETWRALYGQKSPRVRDQELILRIIALFVDERSYSRPLKKYLNEFVGKHRNLEGLNTSIISRLFNQAASLLFEAAGRRALRYQSNQVNTALSEALFVGLMRRLRRRGRNAPSPATVGRVLSKLVDDPQLTSSISGSTSTEDNVSTRLQVATEAFLKA